jgi:GGDEF domain-containing protein
MPLETLFSASPNVAVEAGYLAIRALKHLSRSIVVFDTPFGDESDEARELAERILHEIEETEQRPVTELGRVRAEYHISRIGESVGIDVQRGDALLRELRDKFTFSV